MEVLITSVLGDVQEILDNKEIYFSLHKTDKTNVYYSNFESIQKFFLFVENLGYKILLGKFDNNKPIIKICNNI